MTRTLFQGLSAFPLTPVSEDGVVDTDSLSILLERLVSAEVDSIGLLGSTGIYAYLDRQQRGRAIKAAVEVVNGRIPVIVGVGSLRTDWSKQFAQEAERAGADGLLLAPVSYTPLTAAEVAEHFNVVAGATALPLCIYNNPGTTHFSFTPELLARLSHIKNIAAVKMPLPANGDFASEINALRNAAAPDFSVGYSGDWGCSHALLAGADAWYSVVAGVLPVQVLMLAHAALAGNQDAFEDLNKAFEPLWTLFKRYGSLRVMYVIADILGLTVGNPPAPVKRIPENISDAVAHAMDAVLNYE